ncbi:hypothetical protein MBAV_003403 [Candidatus Magnetobacterium bavaricum]|uniref:DUF3696 domain-containing protein n=1 Tax=Candidatus Magnetobacterium bavaricum TaxID=29290 RepID=A0A0F3GUQ0_9BACT|nr:hypothetical protein MBAV_003403 [Candidatus Magnetobacterium bavaricum]
MAARIFKTIIEYEENNEPKKHNWEYNKGKDKIMLYNLLIISLFEKNELLLPDFERIHYVSANRIGPQDVYQKASTSDFLNVGSRGEFTANILDIMKNKTLPESSKNLLLPTIKLKKILDQTSAWLDHIFTGGKITIDALRVNLLQISLNSDSSRKMHKPSNVGFGYSYALPIIVSALIAEEGDILIVENPEAHLHPSAQAKIAYFLTLVSTCGVQVFIESHSDHILNGLRIAVKDEIIAPGDVNVMYFHRDDGGFKNDRISVDSDGMIEKWPKGFFDQSEIDLLRIHDV